MKRARIVDDEKFPDSAYELFEQVAPVCSGYFQDVRIKRRLLEQTKETARSSPHLDICKLNAELTYKLTSLFRESNKRFENMTEAHLPGSYHLAWSV